MYKDKVSIKIKCPKHPNYSAKNGPGPIKANCRFCWDICNIRAKFEALKRQVEQSEKEFTNF